MKGRERQSGPAWNCFRAEFRRRWRGRNIARAMGWLLLISGLQLSLILGSQRLGTTPGRPWFAGLLAASLLINLFLPFTLPFLGVLRSASPATQSYLLIRSIVALPWLACHFLMPGAAANSITPDREQRRLSELILAGLTPRQIIVAKGLAAVLPFLITVVAAFVISSAAYLLVGDTDAGKSYVGFFLGPMSMSGTAISLVGLILSAAILVCISALSPRTRRSLIICYGFEFVLVPVLSLVSQIGWALILSLGSWTWFWPWNRFYSYLAPGLTVLLLEAVALLLLWPRALRALAYPDEVAGSPPAVG